MKESIIGLANKMVALPGQLIDMVSGVVSNPQAAVKYVVLIVLLLDVYSGGELVGSILSLANSVLSMISKNVVALAVAVVGYIAIKK